MPESLNSFPDAREAEFANGTYAPHGTHLSAFYEIKGDGTATVTDTVRQKSIVYEADPTFAYRMLFATKDGGFFVCEPQTSAIDCFHLEGSPEDYGLIVLSPGETKKLWTRISVK